MRFLGGGDVEMCFLVLMLILGIFPNLKPHSVIEKCLVLA